MLRNVRRRPAPPQRDVPWRRSVPPGDGAPCRGVVPRANGVFPRRDVQLHPHGGERAKETQASPWTRRQAHPEPQEEGH